MQSNVLPVTVCITTKNNEDTIRACIESVFEWTDELVVVDSESKDKTVDICEEYGANVYQYSFKGFADLKSKAMELARNDWVFILDADEEVPPELRDEILHKFGSDDIVAYHMKKQNYVMGSRTHHQHEKRPLLAKREALYYQEDYIWERLSVKDKHKHNTITLKNTINHFIFERVSEMEKKFSQYSALEALRIVDKNKEDNGAYLFFKGLAIAAQRLFVKKGILDGYRGIFFAFMSFYQFFGAWVKIQDIRRIQESSPEEWRKIWLSEECQRE